MKSLMLFWIILLSPAAAFALPAEDHWTTDLDPKYAAALSESAQLLETERYCEALPMLEELASALPANADVFNMLGYVHRKMDELDVSAKHYERALYLNPNHLGALEYQGELFLRRGNLDGALANLRKLEKACSVACEERDQLKTAIIAHQTRD